MNIEQIKQKEKELDDLKEKARFEIQSQIEGLQAQLKELGVKKSGRGRRPGTKNKPKERASQK